MPEGFAATVSEQTQETLAFDRRDIISRRDYAVKRLRELDQQEERLVDAVADRSIPSGKLRGRLQKLTVERVQLEKDRQSSSNVVKQAVKLLSAVLHFLEDPQAMYQATADLTRRRMNDAFFDPRGTEPSLCGSCRGVCRLSSLAG